MLVRAATSADAAAIHEIHKAAFGSDAEARLVAMLEADGDALVSLVAGIEGAVVGHAMFSRMNVEADGKPLRAAGLAPVGVLPAYQGLGFGGALIREGLSLLPKQGVEMSFVLGHEAYYPRLGYSAALAAPFASPYAGPHFMALAFDTGFTAPSSGRADYAPAFARL